MGMFKRYSRDSYSCRTTVRRDLLILIPPLYWMKPSFLNLLTDKHGDEVKLKKGAHVDVTVTAEDALVAIDPVNKSLSSHARLDMIRKKQPRSQRG